MVTHQSYSLYGGRGISVCERWDKFENFYADMGPRPSPRHSIERLDNNGSYTPENCVWATKKEQGRNRRNNRLLTVDGKTKPLTQWAEELNIAPHLVYNRLRYGWTQEAALNPAVRKYRIKDPLKQALKAGEEIPGVALQHNEHLMRR